MNLSSQDKSKLIKIEREIEKDDILVICGNCLIEMESYSYGNKCRKCGNDWEHD